MSGKILVIGSANTDMIVQVPYIPRPGETILGGTFSTAPGGKGANQAVAAARAGGQVTFITRLGKDMFGDNALQGYHNDGIDTSHIIRDATAPSGVAMIYVAKDGENSIAVASGANMNLSPGDLMKAESALDSADILLMQLEIPLATVETAAAMAYEKNIPVILNPAPAQELSEDLLKTITILTPNESEAQLLTGIPVRNHIDAGKAAKALLDKGVKTVIVTLGGRGALIVDENGERLVKSFEVKAIDTTAAGDVFNGALAVALALGKMLDEAVRFANAAAALSVTRLGAQPSAPHRNEIESFQSKLKA